MTWQPPTVFLHKTGGGNRARPDLIRKFFPQNDGPRTAKLRHVCSSQRRPCFIRRCGTYLKQWRCIYLSKAVMLLQNSPTSNRRFSRTWCHLRRYRLLLATCCRSLSDILQKPMLAWMEETLHLKVHKQLTPSEVVHMLLPVQMHIAWMIFAMNGAENSNFEGRRRMDLIRFNRYGGNNNYTWQWKGGSYEGRSFDAHLNIFGHPDQWVDCQLQFDSEPGILKTFCFINIKWKYNE